MTRVPSFVFFDACSFIPVLIVSLSMFTLILGLFLAEIIEGSSYNKVIELYNPTEEVNGV